MKISLTLFQLVLKVSFPSFIILVIATMINLDPRILLLIKLLAYPGFILGALLAATNAHRQEIIFTWKEKNTELHVPFGNFNTVSAFDNDGNRYQMNMLMIPKLLEKE